MIIFEDGVYFEYIAFVPGLDPEKRAAHWWGDKIPVGPKNSGLIDFALRTADVKILIPIRDRVANTGAFKYVESVAGGRITPDGIEMKREVTFPTGVPRGSVPFFCHDLTDRGLRVPINAETTRHPVPATGFAVLVVNVPVAEFDELVRIYEAIFGTAATPFGEDQVYFEVDVPNPIPGTNQPRITLHKLPNCKSTKPAGLAVNNPPKNGGRREPESETKQVVV